MKDKLLARFDETEKALLDIQENNKASIDRAKKIEDSCSSSSQSNSKNNYISPDNVEFYAVYRMLLTLKKSGQVIFHEKDIINYMNTLLKQGGHHE